MIESFFQITPTRDPMLTRVKNGLQIHQDIPRNPIVVWRNILDKIRVKEGP